MGGGGKKKEEESFLVKSFNSSSFFRGRQKDGTNGECAAEWGGGEKRKTDEAIRDLTAVWISYQ